MSRITDEIMLYAAALNLGENCRVVCPHCQGGSTKEKSLSITLDEDGAVKWQCFRAKCALTKGSEFGFPHNRPVQVAEQSIRMKSSFEGPTEPLRESDLKWIESKWGITDPPHWYYTPKYGGRIAMSIRTPKFQHAGWSLRALDPKAHTKALTFVGAGQIGMSWYKTVPQAPTVIVEDIPSAVRASKYVNSVALLGTGIGLSRAKEIADNTTGPIIVALDNDATDLSFKYAEKYKLLWGDVRVLPLKIDIKDMPEDAVRRLFT